ncbi:MAG: hypothetical protein IJO32_00805 [Bacilli bacterium]|nr:hypothetical protein [Bacilli bacterium]
MQEDNDKIFSQKSSVINSKNINPLIEIPNAKMKLYEIDGISDSIFFDTIDELEKYIISNMIYFYKFYITEFMGDMAGESNVIRKSTKSGMATLYTMCDINGYKIYNPERSIYEGKFIWEYVPGKIDELYKAFRERGIVIENDIYANNNKKLIKVVPLNYGDKKGD